MRAGVKVYRRRVPALVAPRSPATVTPPRRPGTVRRTTHIEMSWDGPQLHLAGAARDLETTDQGARVRDAATLDAEVDPRRRLAQLQLVPDRPDAMAMVGSVVGSGFRAQVAAVLPGERGTPLGLLLDDLPGATLISGYVRVRSEAHAGLPPGSSVPVAALEAMTDVCSGWRTGGRAMASVASGDGIPLQDCPPAPDLLWGGGISDRLAWHDIGPLAPRTMRRRRRIDVGWPAPGPNPPAPSPNGTDDPIEVDAMFRDSYGEPDGTEVVLHEYGLQAVLDPYGLIVRSIEATPAVLPFGECPLAAGNVDDLVGRAIGDFRSAVREQLTGVRSCTHLNDMLRVLADVAYLVQEQGQPGRRAQQR